MRVDKKLQSFLDWEMNVTKTSLDEEVDNAVCLFTPKKYTSHTYLIAPGYREVFKRLMLTKKLYHLFGMARDYGWTHGYPGFDDERPKNRLQFVRYFISHEIEDDGCPGLAWRANTILLGLHKLNTEVEGLNKEERDKKFKVFLAESKNRPRDAPYYIPCTKDTYKAEPTIIINRDTWPLEWNTVEWPLPEGIISAVDHHENMEVGRKERYKKRLGEEEPRTKEEAERWEAIADITEYVLEESKRRGG